MLIENSRSEIKIADVIKFTWIGDYREVKQGKNCKNLTKSTCFFDYERLIINEKIKLSL